jgi:hypothetical protein
MSDFRIKLVGDFTLSNSKQMLDKVVNELMTEVKTQVSGRTPIDTGRARRGWQQRSTKVVENSVPYIEKLERGYSRQAPKGFVRQGITAAVKKFNKGTTK